MNNESSKYDPHKITREEVYDLINAEVEGKSKNGKVLFRITNPFGKDLLVEGIKEDAIQARKELEKNLLAYYDECKKTLSQPILL